MFKYSKQHFIILIEFTGTGWNRNIENEYMNYFEMARFAIFK